MAHSKIGIRSVISNDQKELNGFLETLGERLDESGVDFAVATRIQVCLDEMLSNALKYGYPPEQAGEIEISIGFAGDEVAVTVCDDGVAFNPFERDAPESLDQSLEDRDIGGLGIHIVKNMATRFDYQRDGDRNINKFWLAGQ
ncbi:ATP-binding protein [Thalassospira sp. MA62]|nr:ATP-binding protein [Thalassospira sp. MA62]